MKWLLGNLPLVGSLTLEHLAFALPPVLIGLVLAVPLGWLANRTKVGRTLTINVAGLLYTIPSLALFVLLPPFLGTRILDAANVYVALTVYTVALLVRVVADGLAAVPDDVAQAATAMGFTRLQRLRAVELPLAVPVIAAGLRVATVANVSLVAIAATIPRTTVERCHGCRPMYPPITGPPTMNTPTRSIRKAPASVSDRCSACTKNGKPHSRPITLAANCVVKCDQRPSRVPGSRQASLRSRPTVRTSLLERPDGAPGGTSRTSRTVSRPSRTPATRPRIGITDQSPVAGSVGGAAGSSDSGWAARSSGVLAAGRLRESSREKSKRSP